MSDTPGEPDARDTFVAHPTPPAPAVRKRGRRVTTQPVPGSDPTPAPIDRRVDSRENDARLRGDRPPHWG